MGRLQSRTSPGQSQECCWGLRSPAWGAPGRDQRPSSRGAPSHRAPPVQNGQKGFTLALLAQTEAWGCKEHLALSNLISSGGSLAPPPAGCALLTPVPVIVSLLPSRLLFHPDGPAGWRNRLETEGCCQLHAEVASPGGRHLNFSSTPTTLTFSRPLP